MLTKGYSHLDGFSQWWGNNCDDDYDDDDDDGADDDGDAPDTKKILYKSGGMATGMCFTI